MNSWPCLLLAGLLLALGAGASHGQIPAARPAAAAASAAPAADPLERDTPRRAIIAFARAVERDDYAAATRYAQLNRQQQRDAEVLLRDLNELMSRYLRRPFSTVSDAPEGNLDDGLPPDRERIGPLRIGDEQYAIEMVRVDDAGVRVWLISSDTIRGVPRFHASLPPTWAERLLPPWLAAGTVFGVSIVRVGLWGASILLPLLLLHFLFPLLRLGFMRIAPLGGRAEALALGMDRLQRPVALVAALGVHLAVLPSFITSLPFRIAYSRVTLVLLVVVLAWGAERVFTLLFVQARAGLPGAGQTGARSLLMLGERLLKVLLVVVALLVILSLFGVDTRTALAGLGIVGFAVALGAKKTVENILGGVMLLGDQAIAIGDECNISGRQGVVEDITLRSVRLRTREQTLLSIPSGVLADASIENFSSRGKYLADDTLHLSLDATSAQVRLVRDGIEGLLRRHADVEQRTARIRLVGYASQGVQLRLHAFFATANYAQFLAAREDLLLQIAALVEEAGCTFAAPYGPALQRKAEATPAPAATPS